MNERETVATFSDEQRAEIKQIAECAAEHLLNDFAEWIFRQIKDSTCTLKVGGYRQLADDFLAQKRGWYD